MGIDNSKQKRLLSRLLMIKSDLQIIKPEDYDPKIKEKVARIKQDVNFMIKNLIKKVK